MSKNAKKDWKNISYLCMLVAAKLGKGIHLNCK